MPLETCRWIVKVGAPLAGRVAGGEAVRVQRVSLRVFSAAGDAALVQVEHVARGGVARRALGREPGGIRSSRLAGQAPEVMAAAAAGWELALVAGRHR